MTAPVVIAALIERGLTIATAESLTGGLVAAALTSVPGASEVVAGGVVSYTAEVKARVLGVDRGLLAERGAVDPEVAAQMAQGTARVVGADIGVATTGVAGPSPADGKPVGLVYVAACLAGRVEVRECAFTGSRESIRGSAVAAALDLVSELLERRERVAEDLPTGGR